nr:winged helix-turn-helix domain-containing protein [Enterococcus sp. DIV0660C]
MKAKVESLRSALLKQKKLKTNNQPVYQKFQVLEEKQVILLHEQELSLTKSEYRLFSLLLNHPLRIFSREELLILLGNEEGSGRVIDTHIKNIRKKIEEVAGSANYIQTVHGRGYRFTNATH